MMTINHLNQIWNGLKKLKYKIGLVETAWKRSGGDVGRAIALNLNFQNHPFANLAE